ncbi:MAG: hypothetical protein QOJ92_1107 [Frankiales bacterium]|nr:hypothetical protein [Frankiales bacterium]
MNTRRILILSTAVLGTVLAAPAGASPKSSPTHFVAPYANAATNTSTSSCLAGTTCSPTATASRDTGQVVAAVDMSRSTNDQSATEHAQGYGYQYLTVRAPASATKLTATFAWHITSASSSVNATHGEVAAGSHLYAYAGCGKCTVATQLVTINESRMTAGIPSDNPSGGVQNQTAQLTITITDFARNANITLYAQAAAYANMGTGTSCYLTPAGCVVVAPPDSGHSGTAHAEIDATLTAVDLVYS